MLSSGKRIGPYEIVSMLGAGGMGEVYRAKDVRLARAVALKVLPPEVAADSNRVQRFEQEARAASALNHPNIISIHDIGRQDDIWYLVSELIEGETLREVMRRGPISQNKLLDLARQVADGLAAAHSAGLVHRDLKPENLMVTGAASGHAGRVKILDFGLAKQVVKAAAVSEETAYLTPTSPGAVLGTAQYMSPEQVRGDELDHHSDIFSFGLILYEAISGKPPFARTTAAETMTAILREDPPDLPETVSPALREIVMHCLEKEPASRFHSARDLGFALRTVSHASTRTSGSVQAVAAAAPGRRRWLWPSVAALLTAALVALAIPHMLELEPIELEHYRYTPFATDPDPESEGVWAPNGRSIAYVRSINGVAQLMVRALDAAAPVQLTRSESGVAQPFWAPDSAALYYLMEAERRELWAVSPAGGRPSRILDDVDAAAISPDGKSLAIWRTVYAGDKAQGSVWISSPPGSAPKRYLPAPFETERPSHAIRLAFAPNGRSLLLIANNIGAQIWMLPFPAGKGTPRRLFADMDFGLLPSGAWLSDSRHGILSFAQSGGEQALWLADFKRQRLRKLTASTTAALYPSPGPDGRRLVFTSSTDDYELVELPLDGSPIQTLTLTTRNEYSPSWSRQGDLIVYSTDRAGGRQIWIRNTKAGGDRPAVTANDFEGGTTLSLTHPVFSPDGSRFAFVRYSSDEPTTIWVAPTVGGAPIQVSQEFIQSPAWSPDGNTIAGLVQKGQPWQPALIAVGSDAAPQPIPHAPSCRTPLDWSPTGEWIACESVQGVALFSPDGSKVKMLPQLHATAVVFSPDGRQLYGVGHEKGHAFLKAIDVGTEAVRTIGTYKGEMTISGGLQFQARLTVSPDGKSIATSAVVAKSDLWILEGYPVPHPWWHFWE